MKFIFDLDNTICESGQKITPEMKELLSALNPIIISGATREKMLEQLDGLECEIMAQSGNDTDYWFNGLSELDEKEIMGHVETMEVFPANEFVELLQNRGCQISLSLVGHNAPQDIKVAFDPDKSKRKKLLEANPFKSQTLMCTAGGTTCIDYTLKNGTKGKNLKRYLEKKGVNPVDCIYFGDALGWGGNDESVIGVIPNLMNVDSPKETLEILKRKLCDN